VHTIQTKTHIRKCIIQCGCKLFIVLERKKITLNMSSTINIKYFHELDHC